jgi:hypothetical protein
VAGDRGKCVHGKTLVRRRKNPVWLRAIPEAAGDYLGARLLGLVWARPAIRPGLESNTEAVFPQARGVKCSPSCTTKGATDQSYHPDYTMRDLQEPKSPAGNARHPIGGTPNGIPPPVQCTLRDFLSSRECGAAQSDAASTSATPLSNASYNKSCRRPSGIRTSWSLHSIGVWSIRTFRERFRTSLSQESSARCFAEAIPGPGKAIGGVSIMRSFRPRRAGVVLVNAVHEKICAAKSGSTL